MPVKKSFEYKLGQKVEILDSKEKGIIVARSHSLETNPQYFVRYTAGNGCQVESWWAESAIIAR